jgi:hypothetical protein
MVKWILLLILCSMGMKASASFPSQTYYFRFNEYAIFDSSTLAFFKTNNVESLMEYDNDHWGHIYHFNKMGQLTKCEDFYSRKKTVKKLKPKVYKIKKYTYDTKGRIVKFSYENDNPYRLEDSFHYNENDVIDFYKMKQIYGKLNSKM